MSRFATFLTAFYLAVASPAVSANTANPLHLVAAGQYAEARAALKPLIAGSPTAPLDAAQLEGLILLHQGRTGAAIDHFRAMLEIAPAFKPARRELAMTLARSGDHAGARREVAALAAQTRDPAVKAYLRRMLAQSRRAQGADGGVGFRFSLTPSDNINSGTKARTVMVGDVPFTIDDASRAKSGVGVNVGATAWRRWMLPQAWDATAALSLDVTTYPRNDIDTETTLGARVDFGRSFRKTRFTFGPVLERLVVGGEVRRDRAGLSFGITHQPSPETALTANVTAVRQTWPEQSYRDGSRISGALGWKRKLSPRTTVALSMPFDVEKTRRAHLDHHEIGLAASVDHHWEGGLHTGLTVSIARDQYSGDYPGLDRARRDRITKITGRISHDSARIGKLVPVLSLTHTRHRSNVPFNDYTSRDIGLGFRAEF